MLVQVGIAGEESDSKIGLDRYRLTFKSCWTEPYITIKWVVPYATPPGTSHLTIHSLVTTPPLSLISRVWTKKRERKFHLVSTHTTYLVARRLSHITTPFH
jgi:hypothetical protein